jgi:hypothetical protein
MAVLTPQPKMQFTTAAGVPLSGGKVYTYIAGTTTPQATFTDYSGATPNPNPVILDSRGEANIWLGGALYKFKLTDVNDVEIWTVDYISAPTSAVSPVLSGNVTIDSDTPTPALKITQTGTGPVMRVQDSADPDATPFIIDNAGNVGIGTATPTQKLDVYTDAAAVSTIVARNTVSSLNFTMSASGAAQITQTGAYSLQFATSNTERVRITDTGDVGIGVSTPIGRLQVAGGRALFGPNNEVYAIGVGFNQARVAAGEVFYVGASNATTPDLIVANASGLERARITDAGLFQFNSGFGSVATAYGCRAWVNFNGTGTVAIRASGNVSSITDNGTGQYGVNFTAVMPDTNYSFVGLARNSDNLGPGMYVSPNLGSGKTTALCDLLTFKGSSPTDASEVNIVVFR